MEPVDQKKQTDEAAEIQEAATPETPMTDGQSRREFLRKSVKGLQGFALVTMLASLPPASAHATSAGCNAPVYGGGTAADSGCGNYNPSSTTIYPDDNCGNTLPSGAKDPDGNCGKGVGWVGMDFDKDDNCSLSDLDQNCGKTFFADRDESCGMRNTSDENCSKSGVSGTPGDKDDHCGVGGDSDENCGRGFFSANDQDNNCGFVFYNGTTDPDNTNDWIV